MREERCGCQAPALECLGQDLLGDADTREHATRGLLNRLRIGVDAEPFELAREFLPPQIVGGRQAAAEVFEHHDLRLQEEDVMLPVLRQVTLPPVVGVVAHLPDMDDLVGVLHVQRPDPMEAIAHRLGHELIDLESVEKVVHHERIPWHASGFGRQYLGEALDELLREDPAGRAQHGPAPSRHLVAVGAGCHRELRGDVANHLRVEKDEICRQDVDVVMGSRPDAVREHVAIDPRHLHQEIGVQHEAVDVDPTEVVEVDAKEELPDGLVVGRTEDVMEGQVGLALEPGDLALAELCSQEDDMTCPRRKPGSPEGPVEETRCEEHVEEILFVGETLVEGSKTRKLYVFDPGKRGQLGRHFYSSMQACAVGHQGIIGAAVR